MGSRRSKAVTVQLTTEHEHDFWARVDRSDEGGCWIWTGYKDKDGYPLLRIDKERIGAPRVAWALHHRQPLPSYQQVRRRCSSRGCVRPTHMARVPTKYATFAKRNPNSHFTVLKPPEGGKTEAPRQETIVALSGSYKELRQLKVTLHALTGALPQSDRKQQKNHEKTHSSIAELVESVESLREEMMRWTARVDQRLLRIERAIARDEAEPEPRPTPQPEPSAPTSQVPDEPEPPTESGNGAEPGGMSLVLMTAFQSEFGGPGEPRPDDYESLDMVFDIALGEAKEPSAAVDRFGAWLSSFHKLTVAHPTMEPTPQGFAREVAARRLEDG
jgi:hypothetical protein